MKNITVNGIPYVIKFTTRSILNLDAKGVTLGSLGEQAEAGNFAGFYVAFHEGISVLRKDMTFDDCLELLDNYFEENEENNMNDLAVDLLEEMAVAMGLGKAFKKGLQEEKAKVEKAAKKKD